MSDTETKPRIPPAADREPNGTGTDAPAVPAATRGKGLGATVLDFMSSFGFTCIILLGLMVLTYFGTYAQKSVGLVRAQQIYFDSFICRIDLVPFEPSWWPFVWWPSGMGWPGGYLLLLLLLTNLVLGGIIRIKWSQRTAGILIGHFGIILLLIAGFVKFTQSTNGYLQFWPNEVKSEYISFHDWEVAIGETRGDGTVREHLIPDSDLRRLGTFKSAQMPFELVVLKYFDNCMPRKSKTAVASDVVDGIYLVKRERAKEAPMEAPGAYVEVRVDGEKPQRGILWGDQQHPWTVTVKGVPWTIDLRKQVMDLPFAVRLEKFEKELHPGVDTPRHFSSDVVKIQDGMEQKFRIWMNNPMRYGGFIFSQNNWGPQDGSPGPYYSVLEVSSNPSDQWPMYACIVIAIGLLYHFLSKLFKYARSQKRAQQRRLAS